jgi:hypothetical protein
MQGGVESRMNAKNFFFGAVLLAVGCDRGPNPAIGQQASAKASEHVNEGRDGVDRLAQGFLTVMGKVAVDLRPSMADTTNVARIRNRLWHDLHDDHTDVGRDLTLYPTFFLSATGTDGKGIAGDRSPEQDFLPGKDLAGTFPCVRAALNGTGGTCVGEMSSMQGQPPRVYLIASQPIRAQDDGPVVGAAVGAITFTRLSKAVRELLNLRTVRDHVQIYVGFSHNGRLIPSGTVDNDIAAAFLIPDALVPKVPRDVIERTAGGTHTFTFSQNDGRMQWGGAAGRVPTLGNSTAIVVFRAPLRQ